VILTRFWIKQNDADAERNLSGFREATLGTADINKTTITRKTTTHRLDVPEQHVEDAFQFCLSQLKFGCMIMFQTYSDIEEDIFETP
jgi:hypothetical protein